MDIYQQPDRHAGAEVLVAPTLAKLTPVPIRRLVGDISNTAAMLCGLRLTAA